jgi:hypothetical protein
MIIRIHQFHIRKMDIIIIICNYRRCYNILNIVPFNSSMTKCRSKMPVIDEILNPVRQQTNKKEKIGTLSQLIMRSRI